MKKLLFALCAFAFAFACSAQSVDELKQRRLGEPFQLSKDTTATPVKAPVETVVISGHPSVVLDYNNPTTFFQEGFIGLLKAAVLAFIAALGAFIPGLREIASGVKGGKLITSFLVAFVSVVSVVTFREGMLTDEFFNTIKATFFPDFAYAGLIWSAVKTIKGFIKK